MPEAVNDCKILVINCGSSSLKYEVWQMPERTSSWSSTTATRMSPSGAGTPSETWTDSGSDPVIVPSLVAGYVHHHARPFPRRRADRQAAAKVSRPLAHA